jgi:hypothetical protein
MLNIKIYKVRLIVRETVIYFQEQLSQESLEEVASEVLKHINDVKADVDCVNCELMEKQLLNALSELKSAEKIIAILREDLKCNTMESTADHQTRALSSEPCGSECEVSDHNQISGTWITVARNNRDRKMTRGINATNI